MPRARNQVASGRRHKDALKSAKGYWGGKSKLYRTAVESVKKALKYAYRDRRVKKRDFRRLWIIRINAAARINDISYSRLIQGLIKANVIINRKLLADVAVRDPKAFTKIVEVAKSVL